MIPMHVLSQICRQDESLQVNQSLCSWRCCTPTVINPCKMHKSHAYASNLHFRSMTRVIYGEYTDLAHGIAGCTVCMLDRMLSRELARPDNEYLYCTPSVYQSTI